MIGFLVSFSFEREAPRHGFHRAGRLAGFEAECSRNDRCDAVLLQLRAASEYGKSTAKLPEIQLPL
jgi:hypothetical protein